MIAYGNNGETREIALDNPQNNFERAKTDVFGFESPDLGDFEKVKIWHDNSGNALPINNTIPLSNFITGFGAAWFLDKVIITNTDTNENTYFLCGRWFAKDEDDGLIEREIPSSAKDGQASEPLIQYRVIVHTGDRRGTPEISHSHFFLTKNY